MKKRFILVPVFGVLLLAGLTANNMGYPASYIIRVLTKQDANADDYLWKNSYPIAASEKAHALPAAISNPQIKAAFESHELVDDLDAYMEETGTTALIVARSEETLYENYFNGSSSESLQATFSVSKSILSILIGQAIARGEIESLDEPITHYVPELLDKDPRFGDIKLSNLIDMNSGLAYSHELTFPFFNNDEPMVYYAADMRKTVIRKTKITEPPGNFLYNDYNPNLLALALERATGTNPVKLVHDRVWAPLGAQDDALWSVDDKGFPYWESGFVATARDQVKIGQMMLHEGTAEHGRIINQAWHQRTVSYKLTEGDNYDVYDGRQWAYLNGWWNILRPDGAHDYSAIGRFGQFIYVSPSNDIVIIRTGTDQGAPSDGKTARLLYHVSTILGERRDTIAIN